MACGYLYPLWCCHFNASRLVYTFHCPQFYVALVPGSVCDLEIYRSYLYTFFDSMPKDRRCAVGLRHVLSGWAPCSVKAVMCFLVLFGICYYL